MCIRDLINNDPSCIGPLIACDPVTASIATAVVGAAGLGLAAKGQRDARKQAAKVRRQNEVAALEQKKLQDAQTASQLRQQQTLDDEEQQAQSRLAVQRRAIVARRRGRGALAYIPTGGLKSKLGE